MVVSHHRSLKTLPSANITNNSDDEDNDYKFDFTSFPTIADPEQNKGQTLSHMITSTLRKVTNNASNLVHNYSKVSNEDRTNDSMQQTEDEIDENAINRNLESNNNKSIAVGSGGDESERIENVSAVRSHIPMIKSSSASNKKSVSFPVSSSRTSNLIANSSGEGTVLIGDVGNSPELSSGSETVLKSGSGPGAATSLTIGESTVGSGSGNEPMAKENPGKSAPQQLQGLPIPSSSNSNSDDLKSLRSFMSTTSINTERAATESPPPSSAATPTPPPSSQGQHSARPYITPRITPRVHSNSKTLSLSTLSIPRLQPTSSTTDTLININASGVSEAIRPSSSATSSTSPPKISKKTRRNESAPIGTQSKQAKTQNPKIDSQDSLQNRISSIFNNLPNDIELSDDDSTSETETINNQSFLISPQRQNSKKQSPKNRKGTSSSHNSNTPTGSGTHPAKKNSHGHLSSVIFDNAKSIINNGINNVVSSSSNSIISGRKEKRQKKKKPKKASDNPLKNGGIPRFYWMNDSFVSDCLNCFKPFTAFRRKHHCRFCGQIFCNDCTLFISYSQHKEERKKEKLGAVVPSNTAKKNYPDKLRVCKPCYSDVIVYLSDDSSSSSDENSDSEDVKADTSYVKSSTPVGQTIPEIEGGSFEDSNLVHPLSRIRSRSTNSRRNSMIVENAYNKGFLASGAPSEFSDTWSPSKQKRLPNSNGNNGIPMTPEVANGKALPGQGLLMAIPTTRKGESVEIPMPIGSYSSTILGGGQSTTSLTGGNVNGNLSATPTNISTTINSKAWLKNYTYNRSNPAQNQAVNNKGNNLDNLSHIYSNFIKKKSNPKLHEADDQNHKGDEANFDSDKSSDEPDVESDNEDEQVMSLYTSLNHHNGGVTVPTVPTLSNTGIIGSSSSLTSRVPSGQFQALNPNSNGMPLNVVVPTLGEFPSMSGGSENRFPRRQMLQSGNVNLSASDGNHNETSNDTSVLSKLFQSSQSTENRKGDILSGEGKSISFIEDRPKSDIRSHERAHASLLRMRSRRKSKSVRTVSLLTHQNNSNNNSSFSNNNFNTSGSGRLPKIDTSFNAHFASNSPSSTPISPTPNFNSSTSLSQQRSNEVANANSSLNLFSPAQVSSSSVIKRTGSAEEMMPVTPILSHASRTSGEFENDMILDDSIYKFEPLRDEDDGERNDIDGFITTGDFNSSVVHFESPYKSNESIYEEFLNNIFVQYLDDSGMKENQDRWSTTISKLFCSVDKIKITDTLDTKQYIKIRRLLGGKIEDSKIVDGIFWTKNIDSKKMLSSIENPKIALLMFPIEYLKQKEQFISLRIVHSQQDVYVTNLVSRLISLEPDVIVVGDTVCGLAEQLLEEAGITVISNTKPQVIERISRYTKTDIFQSVNDLFFKKGSLGTCKKLEVKKYLYQNIIKSFVFFTGNDISSGFTMALRGGDASTLRVVKNATESTIPVRLNAKFEKGLFEDHYLIFRDFGYHTEQIVQTLNDLKSIKKLFEENPENSKLTLDDSEKEGYNELTSDPEDLSSDPSSISENTKVIVPYAPLEKDLSELLNYNTEISKFVSQFDERIIASSPAVKLLLPASLTNLVESYKVLAIFYYKFKQIQNAQSINELTNPKLIEDQFFNIHIDLDKLPYKETDLLKILKYRSSIYLKTLKTNFQSRWRLWSNNMSSITLDPQKRNNIYVLNSTVSIKYATPCYGPVLVVTDNYTENDLCLGLFLDKIFTEASKVCSECGDTYLNHYRTYSHGNGKLDMILEQIQDNITANVYRHDHTPLSSSNPADSPSSDSKRYMWSYCTICNSATPVVAMSDETFYLSIGKFFELCFWGTGVIINSHECGHDFFKHHVRYFGYKDLAIKMVYSPIDTYEVIVPKKQLEYSPDIDIQLKIDSLDLIRKKSSSFFSSISNRLNRVKIDAADKVDDGLRKIEELKALLDEQVEQIEKKTLEIYNSTLPSIHLPMNSVLRNLQELGVVWDNEFVEFEKDFLPSENEIARITQFHLRKYLIDLRNEVKKEEGEERKEVNSKEENGINEKSDTKVQEVAAEAELPKDADSQIKTLENDPEIKSSSQTSMPKPNEEDSSTSNATRSSPELRKQISKMIPSSLLTVNNPSPSVMEKIHKMEALLEYERKDGPVQSPTKIQPTVSRQQSSLAPKSPLKKIVLSNKSSETSLITNNSKDAQNPASSMNPPNKVHNLANFFDQLHFEQISAEFKKQRERELQKKMNRYKAFPVVASKPIVEIYNKIEDAVDVEDKRDASESRRHREKVLSGEDTGSTNESYKGPATLNGKYNIADEHDSTSTNASNNKLPSSDIPQPEKNSLLKNLSSFWADRSATLWEPLDYPLCSSEHTFADSDVIVREDEPSSLIAFCLSSTDYKQKLQSMSEYDQNQKGGGATGNNGAGGVTVISNAINSKKAAQFASIEKKFKKNNSSVPGELEDIMNRFSTTHLKYQYLDGQTALSCKIFYSEQFEAFRKACGNEDSFIQSLSRCVKWDSSGGKSGSSFLKTLDNRYIVKELSKQELESFVAIAPFYFKYMSQSMFNTLTTAIAKIFGFYQIHIRNPTTGKNFKMDFLIMENLFYNKKTTRIFDLKGSMRNRHVQQTGKENEVLLDENMIEYIYESPVFVRDHSKKLLRGSLFNDTAFLSAMDVMDYSLVIGIVDENDEHGNSDPNKKQLYVGIIDCIRTFTWDKKVENWVKGTNLIGGKKGKDPTIVTPKQYRTRFREAMERYILEVPDCWYNF